jgi:hypothetical protein
VTSVRSEVGEVSCSRRRGRKEEKGEKGKEKKRATHVKRDDSQHRLLNDHDEGLADGALKDGTETGFLLAIHGGVPALIARLLSKLLRLSVQDVRNVGLRKESDDADTANTGEDRQNPEDPAEVGRRYLHRAGDDGGEGGTGKGHEGEDGEGVAATVGVPEVGAARKRRISDGRERKEDVKTSSHDATRVRKRRSSEASAQEAEDDHGANVGSCKEDGLSC